MSNHWSYFYPEHRQRKVDVRSNPVFVVFIHEIDLWVLTSNGRKVGKRWHKLRMKAEARRIFWDHPFRVAVMQSGPRSPWSSAGLEKRQKKVARSAVKT